MKDRFKELVGDEKYAEWTTKATTNDEVVPNRIKAADKALFVSSQRNDFRQCRLSNAGLQEPFGCH
jgi:hypothetical protein